MKRLLVTLILAVCLCMVFASYGLAASTADMVDREFFDPHDSRISGEMVVNAWRWYGIDVLPQLVILAAETSLGDPDLGGQLVWENNFGCMRYNGTESKWGRLSDGKAWVAGKDWYSFPTPEVGMMAFGRYLKVGAGGRYLQVLDGAPYDWRAFAAAYHGRNVSGFESYVDRLERFEASFWAKAAANGFAW